MIAYLYTWDPVSRQWCVNDVLDNEEGARKKGRSLWRSGVAGVKIDVTTTVVEEKRK